MGVVVSLLRWRPWSPPAPNIVHRLQETLDSLRRTQQSLTARIAAKRRAIRDVDVVVVEIGLRMQNAGNRLCDVDAAEFRREYRRKATLVRTHAEFCQQLANIDAQLIRLEDAPALRASLTSLHAGVEEHASVIADTSTLLEEVRVAMRTTRSAEAAPLRSLDDLDDDALQAELAKLMNDSTFIGQFDEEELERERRELRRLHAAPAVPTEAPASERVAELDLGI